MTPGSYFNPRAPYGARHAAATGITLPMLISIHAPHTGRDLPTASIPARPQLHFNPRAPYGARPDAQSCIVQEERFQSTRPIRGATVGSANVRSHIYLFQSTRPIRGATSCYKPHKECPSVISIHAPHTGRDEIGQWAGRYNMRFQSTRPIRGATLPLLRGCGIIPLFQSTRPIRGATREQVTPF